MKAKCFAIAAVAAILSLGQEAKAENEEIVKIVLDEKNPFASYGTGVVVRRHPPTVATAAHVVAGKTKVYIKRGQHYYDVVKVLSYPGSDIAFLLADENQVPSFPVEAAWRPNAPWDSQTGQLVGYSWREEPNRWTIEIGRQKSLKEMAVLPDSSPAANLIVALVKYNNTGDILYKGDSGGPVFVGDYVVGLASGFVLVKAGETPRMPFIVPARENIPKPEEMQNLPAPKTTAFNGPLYSAIWEYPFAGKRVASSYEPCLDALATSFGRIEPGFFTITEYRPKDDASRQPLCRKVFEDYAGTIRTEESELGMAAVLEGKVQARLGKDVDLGTALFTSDEDLLSRLSPATRKELEGDKPQNKKPKAAKETEAIVLLQLAGRHRDRAKKAAERRDEILATGIVIPPP